MPDVLRSLVDEVTGGDQAADEETRIEGCLRAAGETRGLKFNLSNDSESGIIIEFDGGVTLEGSEQKETVKDILDCVQNAFKGATKKNDYFSDDPLPLGLVENQWSDGTPSIHIARPSDQEDIDHLYNLVLGPAGGLRSALIVQWCDLNSACVECTPNLGSSSIADASTVSIGLKPGAQFQDTSLGIGQLSGHRKQPYQLIEEAEGLDEGFGRRIGFICSN